MVPEIVQAPDSTWEVHLPSSVSNIPSLSLSKSQPLGTPSLSMSTLSSKPLQISFVSITPSPSESHCPNESNWVLSVDVPAVCPLLTSTLLGTPVVELTAPSNCPLARTLLINILSPPSNASKHPSPSESVSKISGIPSPSVSLATQYSNSKNCIVTVPKFPSCFPTVILITVTGPEIKALTALLGAFAPPAELTTLCPLNTPLAPKFISDNITGVFMAPLEAVKSALSWLSKPPNLNSTLYTGSEKVYVYTATSPLGKFVLFGWVLI